jgi:flagellar biosynthesis GTPase FlhF
MSDAPKDSGTEEVEASFNDDELQDIMNEIESLEQEFSEGEPEASAHDIAEQNEEDIEKELQELEDSIEEEMEDNHEAEVHNIAAKKPSSNTPCVELKAEGSMNMNFSVPVGDQQANVCWDGAVLSISLNGVCIELNSDSCQVDLPGGASFSVPVVGGHKKANAA